MLLQLEALSIAESADLYQSHLFRQDWETTEDVVLVARTEGLLTGGTVSAAIDKLVALAEAGANCL